MIIIYILVYLTIGLIVAKFLQKWMDKDLIPLDIGGWIEFEGDDECEDCKGWNGKDNRCDCGNRRVYWTTLYDSNFRNMQIYAMGD